MKEERKRKELEGEGGNDKGMRRGKRRKKGCEKRKIWWEKEERKRKRKRKKKGKIWWAKEERKRKRKD